MLWSGGGGDYRNVCFFSEMKEGLRLKTESVRDPSGGYLMLGAADNRVWDLGDDDDDDDRKWKLHKIFKRVIVQTKIKKLWKTLKDGARGKLMEGKRILLCSSGLSVRKNGNI